VERLAIVGDELFGGFALRHHHLGRPKGRPLHIRNWTGLKAGPYTRAL
jgi:hypothetical protein